MQPLTIRMKKGRDGPHTLACTRADGSVTVQHNRQDFFPPHDLTHYAVESVLGYRRGFYGLVASGWDLGDFGSADARGGLPSEVDPAELIVGQLDLERGTGVPVDAAQLNALITDWYGRNAPDQSAPESVSESDLSVIRRMCLDLHARWRTLEPGNAIELVFPLQPGTADVARRGDPVDA